MVTVLTLSLPSPLAVDLRLCDDVEGHVTPQSLASTAQCEHYDCNKHSVALWVEKTGKFTKPVLYT